MGDVWVVVVGPGEAGKSSFSRSLADAAGVECIKLDKVFWGENLETLPAPAWARLQEPLLRGDSLRHLHYPWGHPLRSHTWLQITRPPTIAQDALRERVGVLPAEPVDRSDHGLRVVLSLG